jgi:hypothetical protein
MVPTRRITTRPPPPAGDVPGYQHVFLFYVENEDYSQVIGNTKQAPSDANYLALAGGSAFGVLLTDPEEENPLYNIDAANIGDLIAGSGESWKAHLQSANGPCEFLKTELTAILNSPAWRTQRSLATITFDEDAQDYQHPAQRVPTIDRGRPMVTLIDTKTGHVCPPVAVGSYPVAAAITG